MTQYVYSLLLKLSGILLGLELGFIVVVGKPARLAIDVRQGAYSMVAGIALVIVALAVLRS